MLKKRKSKYQWLKIIEAILDKSTTDILKSLKKLSLQQDCVPLGMSNT